MDARWWQLPGPAAFLDLLEQDLREGKSITLALPEHGPAGLRAALAERVRESDLWYWNTLALDDCKDAYSQPARLLHQRFAPLKSASTLLSARTLAAAERFRGLVIWVEGLDAAGWPAWRSFLEEYEHVCRSFSEFDRSMLCVPVAGELTEELPRSGVALSVRRWRGIVDRFDMTIFATQLLRERSISALARRLSVAVVAELAGTDGSLAEELSHLDLEAQLQPVQFLRHFGERRGWSVERGLPPNWRVGTADDLEGAAFTHSAALALCGEEDELKRRVWRGEVGVLFPFIEEQRIQFLQEIGSHLRLPIETPFGIITDRRDLEISHLWSLCRGAKLPGATKAALASLTAMRHSLAHLEPVGMEHLRRCLALRTV